MNWLVGRQVNNKSKVVGAFDWAKLRSMSYHMNSSALECTGRALIEVDWRRFVCICVFVYMCVCDEWFRLVV